MFEGLDNPPKSRDGFIWADYAEILALEHADKCFSRGNLDGIQRRAKDLGVRFNTEDRWRLVIDVVNVRSIEFGDFYPFQVSDDQDTILVNVYGDAKVKIYIALLIASSMRHICKSQISVVARAFENICLQIFPFFLPMGSEVRATGAGGGSAAPYTGTLFNKLQDMAKDIRCTPNFKSTDFNVGDTGDGGIDLIGWHPMADDREGIPIAFAQCGCSRNDWRFKQLEASYAKHSRHFPVMHPWAVYYFLPLDLRQMDGDWAYKSDIGQAIIVDRLRLIRLGASSAALQKIPKMQFVEDIWDSISAPT